MKNYIDAEKLKAEIERRQEERQDVRDSAYLENEYWPEGEFSTRDNEDDAILSIITSFQQDQREIPPLVCPRCMKSFNDCKNYSAYHNRIRYICPHCGYDGDSTEFETSYNSHPIHKVTHKIPTLMIQWTGNNLKEVIDFTGKSPKFSEWFKSWGEFESYVHNHSDILKLFCDDGSHFEVPVGAWIVKTPDGYNVPSVARFIHVKQEQPEVDLKNEIITQWSKCNPTDEGMGSEYAIIAVEQFDAIAHYFYELGLNARKEE